MEDYLLSVIRDVASHLANIGHPVDARGRYDKDGTWQFSEAIPNPVNEAEVQAAFRKLQDAVLKFRP